MNKNSLTLCAFAMIALSVIPLYAVAEEPIPEIEPTPYYENEPQYEDNTGPISLVKTDNTSDVVNETETEAAGALEGEITIHKQEEKFVVYSNSNRVEDLIKGIGAIGEITSNSSSNLGFTPTGKEELKGPAQDIANWFGPCKLETSEG